MMQLARQGVFWTIQGEGTLIGVPMVFVRLAGCSVGCSQCDTDYQPFSAVTPAQLVAQIDRTVPYGVRRAWVWLTGGEPTDQPLVPLIEHLQGAGFRVALATSGVRLAPRVEFLSVSPHTLEGTIQREGDEVKVVPGLNGFAWSALDVVAQWGFVSRYLQPLSGDRAGMRHATEYVKTHPAWRLGIQAHKVWGLP